MRFNFLHKKDDGRIFNERHCTVCGEKVEYADLVRGYEYEKGHYVTLSDADFKSVLPEATQSVEIVEFVDLEQINPMYFDTPYYLEPEKKGRHAYALLRESLREANKVGIAKVVIRSREHLAALKPNGEALVLELMHFADELVEQSDFDFPELKEKVAPAELQDGEDADRHDERRSVRAREIHRRISRSRDGDDRGARRGRRSHRAGDEEAGGDQRRQPDGRAAAQPRAIEARRRTRPAAKHRRPSRNRRAKKSASAAKPKRKKSAA